MAMLLTLDNPVCAGFAFHGSLVVVKMVGVGLTTAYHRLTKKIFMNPEDTTPFYQKSDLQVTTSEVVERTRRNQQNDLENVVPFVLIGFFYVMTDPAPSTALRHFRIFTAARLLHTLAYQLAIPTPARPLCFFAGVGVMLSMAYRVLTTTTSAM